jgi:(1->4)-alpha-D-glucan 1-alpha-D-glucosylmutase
VERINGDPTSWTVCWSHQNYRLAYWRIGGQELDYRRFFDITTLAGLRTERPEVFSAVHDRVLKWLREGVLDGVRIDHPDGLRRPEEYFGRLRDAAPSAWIVAEKILMTDEALPPWPIAGTTGYEVLNDVAGLFVDPGAEAAAFPPCGGARRR